jgi:hypothetical protein
MDEEFEVIEYNSTNLEDVLIRKSKIDPDRLQKKLHRFYFKDYFEYLNAQTIIVENNYIDHDYLEDYAAYYVKCFTHYNNRCTRLHFFSTKFDTYEFSSFLNSERNYIKEEILDESYLGFIVIKPLPQTIFGRTCLTTYPSENHRYFPIIRNYHSNLFGIKLNIRSLAFQEQDHVVAACATSALWSIFHGTGILFQHPIPSPAEITRIATEHQPIRTRTLPSEGLNAEQMAQAIKSVNLEPYLIETNDEFYLKRTIYAYIKAEIPLILGVLLFETSDDIPNFLGQHAIAVSGYNIGDIELDDTGDGFKETSSRINKIYVHDDQVGPFARMVFDKKTIEIQQDNDTITVNSISTSWINKYEQIRGVRAVPKIILIPLYHKIRIPFLSIYSAVRSFNNKIMSPFIDNNSFPLSEKLEWDIYLSGVNNIKSEIINDNNLKGEYFSNILIENMPRFIWRATALHKQEKQFDLLFDATDIEQGTFFLRAVFYNVDIFPIIKKICSKPLLETLCKNQPEWQIVKWFRDQE